MEEKRNWVYAYMYVFLNVCGNIKKYILQYIDNILLLYYVYTWIYLITYCCACECIHVSIIYILLVRTFELYTAGLKSCPVELSFWMRHILAFLPSLAGIRIDNAIVTCSCYLVLCMYWWYIVRVAFSKYWTLGVKQKIIFTELWRLVGLHKVLAGLVFSEVSLLVCKAVFFLQLHKVFPLSLSVS